MADTAVRVQRGWHLRPRPDGFDRCARGGIGYTGGRGATGDRVQATTGQGSGDRLAAAHRALVADPDVQFRLQAADPPPQPPAWLRDLLAWLGDALAPVGRFLRWLFSWLPDLPYAQILFWSVLAIAAAAALWMVVTRVREGAWRLPRRQVRGAQPGEVEDWTPAAAHSRAWLQEADALAAAGRYAEAVHHLLRRSVEDIARRRPQLDRPALTSRELAEADAIPPAPRTLFAGIARLVEGSLFGGRPVSQGDWTTARASYADMVLPRAWRA